MRAKIKEVKTLVEAGKTQIFRDVIMGRFYVKSKDDVEKWMANFDSDLESYVSHRIELAFLEKGGRP